MTRPRPAPPPRPDASAAPAIPVLLVDDQRAVLAGLQALIAGEAPRLGLAGAAPDGAAALALLQRSAPAVVVLDIMLGGEDGLALLPACRAAGAAVVVLSSCEGAAIRQRALALGAHAFVAKAAPAGELIAAIEAAAKAAPGLPFRHPQK